MHFPGIGPRQARRFVYFLLKQDAGYIDQLMWSVKELREVVGVCKDCHRHYTKESRRDDGICEICRDPNTENDKLMIVEKDLDLENIKKSGNYRGRYFVLGALLPYLEKDPDKKMRLIELSKLIEALGGLQEIIIALSLSPHGENTVDYLKEKLEAAGHARGIKFTTLGRGLSTGTELEYADPDTLQNALKNRR